MRILFDQGAPFPISRHLSETASFLLPLNRPDELLLTTDKNLRYRQNLKDLKISIVVILMHNGLRCNSMCNALLRL